MIRSMDLLRRLLPQVLVELTAKRHRQQVCTGIECSPIFLVFLSFDMRFGSGSTLSTQIHIYLDPDSSSHTVGHVPAYAYIS